MRNKEEIREIFLQEKLIYERKRKKFYDNALHWNNNKRKMHGFATLRGSVNKNKVKEYPSFRISTEFFNLIEEEIDERIKEAIKKNNLFDNFVDIKNLSYGRSKYSLY